MIAYNLMAENTISLKKVDSLTLVRLRVLLLMVFFIPFFRVIPFGSNFLTLPLIASYLYLGLCLFSGFTLFNFKRVIGFSLPFFCLVILLWIMTIINYFPKSITAFSNARLLTFLLILFVAISNEIILRPFLANQLLGTIFTSLCFVSILYITGIGVKASGGRASILGINANTLGLYYLLGFLLFLRIFLKGNSTIIKKGLLIVFGAIFLYIIVRTGSRTSLICLLIGCVIFLLSYDLPFRQKVSFLVFGSIAIIMLGLLMYNSDIMQQRFQEGADDETLGHRLPIWEATFPIIYENPWFGNGASGYEANIMQKLTKFRATHNIYLWVLVETGIVGSFAFLLLMFRLGRAALMVNRTIKSPIFLSIWFSYMVFFFTGGGVFATFDLWVIMAILVGSYSVLKNDSALKSTIYNKN